jgi:TrpR-related protein YerC/YecD
MATEARHQWETKQMRELVEAIRSLSTRDQLESFLRDLCTIGELETLAQRWQVARLVHQGLPYLEVAEKTGASTTTVTRVAHWLNHGEGGYRSAIEKTKRAKSA